MKATKSYGIKTSASKCSLSSHHKQTNKNKKGQLTTNSLSFNFGCFFFSFDLFLRLGADFVGEDLDVPACCGSPRRVFDTFSSSLVAFTLARFVVFIRFVGLLPGLLRFV